MEASPSPSPPSLAISPPSSDLSPVPHHFIDAANIPSPKSKGAAPQEAQPEPVEEIVDIPTKIELPSIELMNPLSSDSPLPPSAPLADPPAPASPSIAALYTESIRPRKPYTVSKPRESWTEDEHLKFLEALSTFDRDWKRIGAYVGSKSIIQIRSHAQKYFIKMQKMGLTDYIPPARAKRKARHPYPKNESFHLAHRNTAAAAANETQEKIKQETTTEEATGAAGTAATGAGAAGPGDASSLGVLSSVSASESQSRAPAVRNAPKRRGSQSIEDIAQTFAMLKEGAYKATSKAAARRAAKRIDPPAKRRRASHSSQSTRSSASGSSSDENSSDSESTSDSCSGSGSSDSSDDSDSTDGSSSGSASDGDTRSERSGADDKKRKEHKKRSPTHSQVQTNDNRTPSTIRLKTPRPLSGSGGPSVKNELASLSTPEQPALGERHASGLGLRAGGSMGEGLGLRLGSASSALGGSLATPVGAKYSTNPLSVSVSLHGSSAAFSDSLVSPLRATGSPLPSGMSSMLNASPSPVPIGSPNSPNPFPATRNEEAYEHRVLRSSGFNRKPSALRTSNSLHSSSSSLTTSSSGAMMDSSFPALHSHAPFFSITNAPGAHYDRSPDPLCANASSSTLLSSSSLTRETSATVGAHSLPLPASYSAAFSRELSAGAASSSFPSAGLLGRESSFSISLSSGAGLFHSDTGAVASRFIP